MTSEPAASRPHMPGYGIAGPAEGTGLLPWAWAVERISRAHDWFVATTSSDGGPNVMPVWGVWIDGGMWFSTGRASRKSRNLLARPRVTVTTMDADEPVIVEGRATVVTDRSAIEAFATAMDAKYEATYGVEFYGSANNLCVRVEPVVAFGMTQADFTGSPTRWRFS